MGRGQETKTAPSFFTSLPHSNGTAFLTKRPEKHPKAVTNLVFALKYSSSLILLKATDSHSLCVLAWPTLIESSLRRGGGVLSSRKRVLNLKATLFH